MELFGKTELMEELLKRTEHRQENWEAFFTKYENCTLDDDEQPGFSPDELSEDMFDEKYMMAEFGRRSIQKNMNSTQKTAHQIENVLKSHLHMALLKQEKCKIFHCYESYDEAHALVKQEIGSILKHGVTVDDVSDYIKSVLTPSCETISVVESEIGSNLKFLLQEQLKYIDKPEFEEFKRQIKREYERVSEIFPEKKLIGYCVRTLIDAVNKRSQADRQDNNDLYIIQQF